MPPAVHINLDLQRTSLASLDYSSFWDEFVHLHILITFGFSFIFWSLYAYCYHQAGIDAKHRLLISTNVISCIHSVLVFYTALIAFFWDDFSETVNLVYCEPGYLAYTWNIWMSYMLADTSAHLILYCYYSPSVIPRRYDILAHHFVSYFMLPLMMYPVPIYGWFVFVWPPITEISTIFLNLQWFSRYYQWQTYSAIIPLMLNVMFHVSWFFARLPALGTQLVWLYSHWDEVQMWPVRVRSTGITTCVVINVLHIVWTVLIVKKLWCRAADKKRQ